MAQGPARIWYWHPRCGYPPRGDVADVGVLLAAVVVPMRLELVKSVVVEIGLLSILPLLLVETTLQAAVALL